MQPRISMITLGVSDLEASIRFYRDGLKLPQLASEPGVAFFNLNGTWLGLYPKDKLAEDALVSNDGQGFPGFTLAYNVTNEDEVHQVINEAVAAGAILAKTPQKVFWGGYSGYFKDLDGYLWEIAYNPFMWIGPENKAND